MTETKPAVLVTRRIPSAVLDQLAPSCLVDLHPGTDELPHEEVCARLRGKQGLICMFNDRIDAAVIAAGDSLRVIATVAVGFDNIDVGAAAARGIVVTNTRDILTGATAELTWALILSVTRRIGEADRAVRRGGWAGWTFDFMLGSELQGKQLGIVGAGRIGRAVAAVAPAFGMQVVFSAKPGADRDSASDETVVSLDELLLTSDVVSLHLPLTETTRHVINRRTLARMKRSACLINTSRGPIVDEAALSWALEERLIAGAGLDVFEEEPRVHPGLLQRENVCLTPHIGSATRETRAAMAALAVRNVVEVLAGRPAVTPVHH
ncbi:MAG TPA: D-glycerate dehydrogenase [Acidobacteria bacterium]|nr:D-glycerate dehydrogenase [Acidobacteriota bacterium]